MPTDEAVDPTILTLRQCIAATDRTAADSATRVEALCTRYYAAVIAGLDQAAAASDANAVAACLALLLDLEPGDVAHQGPFRDAMLHGMQWFYADRNRPAHLMLTALTGAIERWSAAAAPVLDVLCDLGDFHFFAAWTFEASSTRQCEISVPAMAALGRGMARTQRPPWFQGLPGPVPPAGATVHVAYLAMFADAADPMAVALRHLVPALLAQPGQFRVSVYAWCNVSAAFLELLRGMGARVHVVTAPRPTELVEAIEALAALDPPAVLISDMNNGLPTAIFARRLAAVQIFLQGGLPAWPVPNLDAVFNSFGFDPAKAGWGGAENLGFETPWDVAHLNPPERPDEVAAEYATLPKGLRWVGNYGRLVKVTEPCLRAAERILQACPDVGFVTGGSGDATAIREFIARSPVGNRMLVAERYVPGHSWGRFLEVFLDTWPLTGGESCREVIAKGRPVVSLHSAEMPALDLQRDPALVAMDWDGYVERTVHLLNNPDAHAAACARAAALASRMAEPQAFAATTATQLRKLLARARFRQGWLGRQHARLGRLIRP